MPLATAVRPSPDRPDVIPPGRVGIVGVGAFGRFCLDAYTRTADLSVIAVADPDPSALDQLQAPAVRREREWQSLLADDAIEVLHLATPPHVRAEVVFAALRAGKSVFCEKPLALSLAEADAMIEAAERTGVAIGVDYIMRHHPAYQLLARLAASGLPGRLRTLSFQNYAQAVPPGHWFWDRSRSGGIFVEHGVHFFDAYGKLAGTPEYVWGRKPKWDAVEATVRYAGGAVGRFYHEFAFPYDVERAVGIAFFERGFAEIEGWIPTRLHGQMLARAEAVQEIGRGHRLTVRAGGNAAVHFEIRFPERQTAYQEAIAAGMRDIVRRHRSRAHQMRVSPHDARESLALALAAQDAVESGSARALSPVPMHSVTSDPS